MTAEMRLRAGGRTLPPPQSFLLGGMTAAVTFLQQPFRGGSLDFDCGKLHAGHPADLPAINALSFI